MSESSPSSFVALFKSFKNHKKIKKKDENSNLIIKIEFHESHFDPAAISIIAFFRRPEIKRLASIRMFLQWQNMQNGRSYIDENRQNIHFGYFLVRDSENLKMGGLEIYSRSEINVCCAVISDKIIIEFYHIWSASTPIGPPCFHGCQSGILFITSFQKKNNLFVIIEHHNFQMHESYLDSRSRGKRINTSLLYSIQGLMSILSASVVLS